MGAAWSFDSELFETVVLQADVVLECGATETAGGVEAVQILVDAVTQGFPDSRVEVESLDRPWFRFCQWNLRIMAFLSGAMSFPVYDAEGHAPSVPLRRSPSGCRILNLLDSAPRRVSLTPQQVTSLKIRGNRI